jgi:hypothetical protein
MRRKHPSGPNQLALWPVAELVILGAVWGPHVMRDHAQRPQLSTSLDTRARVLTCGNGSHCVLGVKGSQVQILSARRHARSPLAWLFHQVRGLLAFSMNALDAPKHRGKVQLSTMAPFSAPTRDRFALDRRLLPENSVAGCRGVSRTGRSLGVDRDHHPRLLCLGRGVVRAFGLSDNGRSLDVIDHEALRSFVVTRSEQAERRNRPVRGSQLLLLD